MTLDDLFRRVVWAHRWLLIAITLIPVAAVVSYTLTQPPQWEGSVRLQVADAAPVSTTEADGISSRVLALATTPGVVRKALRDVKVQRNVSDMALHRVSAARLGESSVVELRVIDGQKDAAMKIASALGSRVADFINQGSRGHFDSVVANLDRRIARATKARDKLIDTLNVTRGLDRRATLRVQISSADTTLTQLSDQRAALVLADASRSRVVKVAPSSADVQALPSELVGRVALSLIVGLALALGSGMLLETIRPRLAGAAGVGRLFGAPVIIGDTAADVAHTVRLIARRHRLNTVVLIGVGAGADEKVAKMLDDLGDDLVPSRSPFAVVAPVGAAGLRERIKTREYAEPARPAPPDSTAVAFTDLNWLRPEQEDGAGVLLISAGAPLAAETEQLSGLLKTLRWQVLGIVAGSRT